MFNRPKVFLSYRRDDSAFQTTMLYGQLSRHFGRRNVFMDVDSIPAGHDFREVIAKFVLQCDVVVAVIGRQWLQLLNERGVSGGTPQNDYVRFEIETALEHGIPVIPLLLDVDMPRTEDLPESLRRLSHRNAVRLRPGPDLDGDTRRLAKGIRRMAQENKPSTANSPEVPVRLRSSPAQWQAVSAVAIVLVIALARVVSEGVYDFVFTYQQFASENLNATGAVSTPVFAAALAEPASTTEEMPAAAPAVPADRPSFQWPSQNLPKLLGCALQSGVALGVVLWLMSMLAKNRWQRMLPVALVGCLTSFPIGYFLYDWPVNPDASMTTVNYGSLIGFAQTFGMTVLLLLSFRVGFVATVSLGLAAMIFTYVGSVCALIQPAPFALTILDGAMHGSAVCIAFAIAYVIRKLGLSAKADDR